MRWTSACLAVALFLFLKKRIVDLVLAAKGEGKALRVQAEIISSTNLRIMSGFGTEKMLARLLENAQG